MTDYTQHSQAHPSGSDDDQQPPAELIETPDTAADSSDDRADRPAVGSDHDDGTGLLVVAGLLLGGHSPILSRRLAILEPGGRIVGNHQRYGVKSGGRFSANALAPSAASSVWLNTSRPSNAR